MARKTNKGKAYRVFISSIQRDSDLAVDLARRIKEAGVRVFSVGRSVRSGKRLNASISRTLREADEVLVILTPSSLDDQWLITEMGAAFGMHKRVTPIVVGIETDEIPPLIKQFRYVRYADLPKLISALKKRAKTVPA